MERRAFGKRVSAPAKTTSRKRDSASLVAIEAIASRILVLRGQRTILDADLAALYGVTTKRLNEQVRRNAERFPADFLFRLTASELQELNRSQFATGSVIDMLDTVLAQDSR